MPEATYSRRRRKRRYRKRKAEDDYPRAFTKGTNSYRNKWQTKKGGKMWGTRPY